jgi:RES domain-containing protein
MSRDIGRFNGAQQRTSYCANNVLVCMAEVLFHMYRRVIERIKAKQPYHDVMAAARDLRCLSIFRVRRIDNLVYVDSDAVRVEFDARICGTNVVFPDPSYEPFRVFAEALRVSRKKGVLYPSARHSKDVCIALFDDETGQIADDLYEILTVELQLICEDHDRSAGVKPCNPMKDKLHPTMGAYRFVYGPDYERISAAGLLNPTGLPQQGLIDFVRRLYRAYPKDACL